MRRGVVLSMSTIGLVAGLLVPAASADAAKPGAQPFTEIESGTRLSANDLRYEDVYRVKSSPDGGGSVVRDVTLQGTQFPVKATDVSTTYYRTGKLVAAEAFTLGTPNVFGVGAISGNGKCTSGTLVHFGETCTYTMSGSYDLLTGLTQLRLKGTETLAAKGKPGKTK